MEESPLGRTEWIKFEAAFLGKDSLAEAIFSNIEARYNSICDKVKQTNKRPDRFQREKGGRYLVCSRWKKLYGQFLERRRSRLYLEKSYQLGINDRTTSKKCLQKLFMLIFG